MLTSRSSRPVGLVVAFLVGLFLVVMPTGADASSSSGHGSGARSQSSRVHVVDVYRPRRLPHGGPPTASYLALRDSLHSPIYRTGKRPLDVGPGELVTHLMKVRGGHVVTLPNYCGECGPYAVVRFVGHNGHRKTLARVDAPHYIADTVASADGRLVAITVAGHKSERITVLRLSDLHRVAHRTFTKPVVVASMTRNRALLTEDGCGGRCTMLSRWWNLDNGRLRLIDKGRPSTYGVYLSPPADLSSGQLTVVRGLHERVIPLRAGAPRAWNTRVNEWVSSWSPDDRFVVTVSEETEAGWNNLTVRRASNGAIVARFGAAVADDDHWSPVWENASTLSFPAGYDCDGECDRSVPVRCTVHGVCKQMRRPADVRLLQERRLPPS